MDLYGLVMPDVLNCWHRGLPKLNPRLVASLIFSTLVALAVAIAAVVHGSGILLAYLAFSGSGAVALVAASFFAAWHHDRQRHGPSLRPGAGHNLAQST